MSEMEQLIELLHQQLDNQWKQMEVLTAMLVGKQSAESSPKLMTIPNFVPLDASSELWTDYWARFLTSIGVNSVPNEKRAQVFLTNQS